MHSPRIAPLPLAAALPLLAAPTLAQENPEPERSEFEEALLGGRTWLNLNFRVERAEQDSFAKDATAGTLRTALGYETGKYRGFRGLIEFEDIANIGNELYNSTTNGVSDRPVVADPDTTEINQVYAAYDGLEDFEFRLGRQEITFGNHRFVGNVAWRQNHQSYDGGRMDWSIAPDTKLTYAYVDTVNRIFGDQSVRGEEQMSTHLVDVRHSIDGVGKVAAYGYLLDFDDSAMLSTLTTGVRFSGDSALADDAKLLYTLEGALQRDTADNPIDVDTEYWLAELGLEASGVTFRLGNEHLGGSGDVGDKFSTPLATLHKFNGFADVFLTTPDTGLEDRYISVAGKIGEVKCAATYHIFQSDTGDIDYGKELDLTAFYAVSDRMRVGAKFADFTADDAYTDTRRVMAWITYRVL